MVSNEILVTVVGPEKVVVNELVVVVLEVDKRIVIVVDVESVDRLVEVEKYSSVSVETNDVV